MSGDEPTFITLKRTSAASFHSASWKQSVWESVKVYISFTSDQRHVIVNSFRSTNHLLHDVKGLKSRSMKASLMPRAPLCFLCEYDASKCWLIPDKRSTACRLSSLLAGWIVSILASQFLLVQRSTEQIKKRWVYAPTTAERSNEGLLGPTASFCLSEIYLDLQHYRNCLCLGCPHGYLPENTTCTSAPPTLVSWNYHLEVYDRRRVFQK